MQQLTGLDAAFVHQDSPRTPMHVTAVLVYDIGTDGSGAIRIPMLRRLVARNIDQFPLFRQKLRRIPMDVDTPYWVDVAEPDWGHHLSRTSLTPSAGWSGLMTLIGKLHGGRMHLSRPLWDMCVVAGLRGIQGLPPNCQALIIRFHHAAIDGVTLARVVAALHGEGAPPAASARAAPEPGYWDIWTRLNLRNIGRQYKFAETVRNLLPGVLRARQVSRTFGDLPPTLATKAHFNDRIATGRSVGARIWAQDEVLAIRRAVRHVTFNDIALSVVGGALRSYLAERRHLPASSLVAGVPISLRDDTDEGGIGNRIATMRVGLGTSEADPVKRLRLVHRYAMAGKKHIDALGTGTVMDISDSVTPNLLARGIRLLAEASLVGDAPVPFHTMVSNVPGPPSTFGPVRDNMGLFHIVSNSASRVSLSFSACARLLPDPEAYSRCLEAAYAELREAAAALRSGP